MVDLGQKGWKQFRLFYFIYFSFPNILRFSGVKILFLNKFPHFIDYLYALTEIIAGQNKCPYFRRTIALVG
ncbi:MAG: hypothetical protein BGO88_00935 [Flavobacterium sp. 38-13]|nr:MAG: hypothetical protein BGO88_00935 [Flavobacterium sp. 38-13]